LTENHLTSIRNITVGIAELRKSFPKLTIPSKSIIEKQEEIIQALNQFMECVRYLNTRRTKGTILSLSSEDDIQDALYIMLRPWVKDLKYEDPNAKVANRFVIKDFYIPSAKTILEAKFIRDKQHGKNISKELHDDIEMYRQLPGCSMIIFFIYDPESFIPSCESLRTSIEIPRSYADKCLTINVIIKP
jgi:hypothetical protein